MNTAAKLQLLKAAILPYLTTAILLGISAERVIKEKLERIQERGLIAVFRDGQSTYEKLLNKAKLITLYERRPQDIAC